MGGQEEPVRAPGVDKGRRLSVPLQVETIRDAYMVVAGVPNKTTFHAHHICDMALDMLSSIDHLKDPSTGDNIQIRVGKTPPDQFPWMLI